MAGVVCNNTRVSVHIAGKPPSHSASVAMEPGVENKRRWHSYTDDHVDKPAVIAGETWSKRTCFGLDKLIERWLPFGWLLDMILYVIMYRNASRRI